MSCVVLICKRSINKRRLNLAGDHRSVPSRAQLNEFEMVHAVRSSDTGMLNNVAVHSGSSESVTEYELDYESISSKSNKMVNTSNTDKFNNVAEHSGSLNNTVEYSGSFDSVTCKHPLVKHLLLQKNFMFDPLPMEFTGLFNITDLIHFSSLSHIFPNTTCPMLIYRIIILLIEFILPLQT